MTDESAGSGTSVQVWRSDRQGQRIGDPTTQLDGRFSDPDATATSWAEARAVLERAPLCWIRTVRADGRPHVTPLVAMWLDDAAWFATGPEEQKAVNLCHNSQVALTTGCNTWDQGLDIVVEGVAELVTEEATLRRVAGAWRGTWDGRWRFTPGDGGLVPEEGGPPAHVFRIRPAKVLAFGNGTFTQTRHAC